MITKRLMALTALASSAALAQQQPGDGNLPAPDLFDSQIACSSALPSMVPTPTVVAEGAESSALDDAIGVGRWRLSGAAILDDLGYVIPTQGSNCGQGFGMAAFTVEAQGSVATDVAAGYSELLPKFIAAYGDPGVLTSTGTAGAVARARASLERAEADENSSTALLDSLRRSLATAQERHNERRAEFNAIAQGPIYGAAAAEWMAKANVTQAIDNYNDAVIQALSTQGTLDNMNFAGYVPLGNSELTSSVVVIFDGMGTVNLSQLNNYTNANLNNPQVATVDDDGVTNSSDSNFDAAGNLVIPMRLVGSDLQTVTRATLVATARTNRDNHRIALETLQNFQAENQNVLLDNLLTEAVRRAQLEANYYEEQFQITVADTTNQNPVTTDNPGTDVDESAPYSIASRNADHVTASNARIVAETDLRNAAAAREAATQAVIDAFQSPGSFYAQLVARRQALKAEADKRVADTSSPSMALTDAATAAAEALTEAEEAHAAYLDLVSDPESPVVDLVNTMLETDGDDGQAVVKAIAETYDGTVENGEAIAALTADTEDGAEEDGPVTANRKAIAANAENIETNTGDIESLDGRVTQNEEDIDALQEDTKMNTGMIATNAGNISRNASNISVNATNIVDNRALIGRNTASLADHGALIERNAGHIALNSERIGANAAAITMNSGLIADNRHMIGELSSDLQVVRAGVAASIALSRMPSIDGGGISFGAGMYAGEVAYAVGYQVQRGFGSIDVGLTSSGGEVGAGVGVGLRLWH